MQHPGFFQRAGPFSLSQICAELDLEPPQGANPEIFDIRPLDEAEPGNLTFLSNKKYAAQLNDTKADACLILRAFADRVPDGTIPIIADDPYRAFAAALSMFYPSAGTPLIADQATDQFVHPSAELEDNVVVEPGAVVAAQAKIGRGTRISAGAVIGYRCYIGRNSYIGPHSSICHCLIGNGVTVHAGCRIGQDGFGYAMSPSGHFKVPQIGRVIIQDLVEIGANTTIDRGALKDTIIGEGSKIDNLVQIGHNVVIGRHCVIVSQTGISGSAVLEDFVVMGGQSGAVGHIKVGRGAQIAGGSHAKDDVPPGSRMGGTPARPFTQWAREVAFLANQVKRKSGG